MLFRTVFAARLIFALGMLNLILAFLLLFLCRCVPTWSFTKSWTNNKLYKSLYKYHCYFWWLFWPSVIVHVIFAVGRLGIPF